MHKTKQNNMTGNELKKAVIKLIDDNCMVMPISEYAETMEDLSSDLAIRAEAARDDIENNQS